MLCKALTTLGGNAEDAYEEFERYHLRPALWCPLQATTSPSPYAWTDDARDSRIEISHDQLLAASWSSRFSLQLRPHSFDCPGGYWRSAAGEPRDDDQLDDCYCIGAGREQLSISGISRWLANQVIRQARCISRFPFQDHGRPLDIWWSEKGWAGGACNTPCPERSSSTSTI